MGLDVLSHGVHLLLFFFFKLLLSLLPHSLKQFLVKGLLLPLLLKVTEALRRLLGLFIVGLLMLRFIYVIVIFLRFVIALLLGGGGVLLVPLEIVEALAAKSVGGEEGAECRTLGEPKHEHN